MNVKLYIGLSDLKKLDYLRRLWKKGGFELTPYEKRRGRCEIWTDTAKLLTENWQSYIGVSVESNFFIWAKEANAFKKINLAEKYN